MNGMGKVEIDDIDVDYIVVFKRELRAAGITTTAQVVEEAAKLRANTEKLIKLLFIAFSLNKTDASDECVLPQPSSTREE
jgi:hypothetical protein